MDPTYDTLPELLRAEVPGFARVYDEHVVDNDEEVMASGNDPK